MVFMPGSVIACPAQRQSTEAVRRVRDILVEVGAKFVSENVYVARTDNSSRVLALPGSDDLIRGLALDAWIVADGAARLSKGHHCRLASDARAARRRVWPCSRTRGAAPDPTLFPADYLEPA